MMLYKNMKSMVHSPDSNTDIFDIVTRVLQGDILAPYMFIICLDYILTTSTLNWSLARWYICTIYVFNMPKVHTDYFNIVTGVLQGDALAPYMFIICLDN